MNEYLGGDLVEIRKKKRKTDHVFRPPLYVGGKNNNLSKCIVHCLPLVYSSFCVVDNTQPFYLSAKPATVISFLLQNDLIWLMARVLVSMG